MTPNPDVAPTPEVPPWPDDAQAAPASERHASITSTSAAAAVASTPQAEPAHFFISYTQADARWAEWIAWQLEASGWRVIIQAWDFPAGGNFILGMQQALERAARVLFVMSPDALTSSFAALEWAATIRQDPTGSRGLLLPVRVRPCEPKGLLASIAYVDLVGARSHKEARQRLMDGVSQLRAKPLAEPDMPPLQPLDPGSPLRPAGPEPRWPGMWRRVHSLGLAALGTLLLAVALRMFLAGQFPAMPDAQLSAAALTLSVLAILIVAAVWLLLGRWRRPRGVA